MPDAVDDTLHEWVAVAKIPVTIEQVTSTPVGGSLLVAEDTYTVAMEYMCDWCGTDYAPGLREQRCVVRGSTRRRATQPPRRIGAEQAVAGDHDWVAGADVPITARQAYQVTVRDAFMIPARTWARARRVYCAWCGQDYVNAVGKPCGGEHQDHLIGGTPGERAKRLAETRAPQPPDGQAPRPGRWLAPEDAALMQHYRFDGLR